MYEQRTYLGRRSDTLLSPFRTVGICLVNHFQRANIYRSLLDAVATHATFWQSKLRTGIEIIRQNVIITLANGIEQPIVTLCQLDL